MTQDNHLDDERAWWEDAMNTHDPDGLFESTSLLDEFIDTLFDFDKDSDIRSHDVMQPAVAAKDLCMKKLPGKGAANAPNAASVCVKVSAGHAPYALFPSQKRRALPELVLYLSLTMCILLLVLTTEVALRQRRGGRREWRFGFRCLDLQAGRLDQAGQREEGVRHANQKEDGPVLRSGAQPPGQLRGLRVSFAQQPVCVAAHPRMRHRSDPVVEVRSAPLIAAGRHGKRAMVGEGGNERCVKYAEMRSHILN